MKEDVTVVEVLEVHEMSIRAGGYGITVIEATHIRQCHDIDVQRRYGFVKLIIPLPQHAGVSSGRKSGL